MRTNFIFIDYENVQPKLLKALHHECFKLFVFLGSNLTKLPLTYVTVMQDMGCRGKYVQIAGCGPNALDFHIAHYLGESVAADPSAFFHVVAEDKGYDPLIQHLKDRGIAVQRVESLEEIAAVRVLSARSLKERLAAAVSRLGKMAGKPASTKTLTSTLSALFLKQLNTEEIERIVDGLRQRGWISIDDGNKVTYQLPAEVGR